VKIRSCKDSHQSRESANVKCWVFEAPVAFNYTPTN